MLSPTALGRPLPPPPTPSGGGLTGTLPPQVGPAWRALEELDLSYNELSGPIPAKWAQMGSLKRLRLRCGGWRGGSGRGSGSVTRRGRTPASERAAKPPAAAAPPPAFPPPLPRPSPLHPPSPQPPSPRVNKLDGTLPSELGSGWGQVESIDLGENRLSGPLPAFLGRLPRLQELLLE
jgi:hypothetical protein